MGPSGSPIRITSRRSGSWFIVSVVGDLDLGTADELREAVEVPPSNGDRLALDLSEIGFIDSSGLRVLLELRQARGAPVLINPSAVVRDLLEMTRMADAFSSVESASDLQ